MSVTKQIIVGVVILVISALVVWYVKKKAVTQKCNCNSQAANTAATLNTLK